MQDFIRIHEADNVAVALRPILKGETVTVGGHEVTTLEEVPQGHKFAIKPAKSSSTVFASAMQRKTSRQAAGSMYTI